jgi:dUTP pyrophosphatase
MEVLMGFTGTIEQPWIVFEPLHEGVVPPKASTADSAGLDAVAYLQDRVVQVFTGTRVPMPQEGPVIKLWQGWRAAVPLGFKAALPRGWEMQVRSRSGLALSRGLVVLNAPGTIDSDYPGEWAVILQNTGKEMVEVQHGDRVAQLVLAQVARMPWKEGPVGVTTDRAGGFGSTGT